MLRPSDALIRLGGDEFVIIVENIENHDVLERILDRLKEVTSKHAQNGGCFQPRQIIYPGFFWQFIANHKIKIGVSLGLTIFPFDDASDEALIHARPGAYGPSMLMIYNIDKHLINACNI